MRGKISPALTILLFTVCPAAAQEPSPSAASGVLLLRNGQVIEGRIERDGSFYTVTAPDQETRIHVAEVECLCRDIRDGYQHKKAAIQPHDIQQHLELLLWCERHGLLDCAREQLDAAEAIDGEHPMISVLRRRLKIESQPAREPARPSETAELPPSDEQLDHMVRGLPPGTVERFVQVVQPILLNHYPGARGYTLPDDKRLLLMRPPLGESPNRRITQRNLYAVLQCIDWNNPEESSMLKASTAATGATVGAFPGRYSMQYEKLAQWVYMVAQKPMPVEENHIENASFADLAGGEESPSTNRPAPHIADFHASLGHAKEKKGGTEADTAGSNGAAVGRHAKAKSPSNDSDTPRTPPRTAAQQAAAQAMESLDPYDPAVFNNQADAPTQMPTPAAKVLQGEK